MKFLIARFNHETNTFSPVATTLANFEPLYGDQALEDQRHARTAMGAFIRLVESQPDASLSTPVSATAHPSGTVAAEAYTHLAETILAGVREQPDAILLDLHGALVAENERAALEAAESSRRAAEQAAALFEAKPAEGETAETAVASEEAPSEKE